MATGIATAKGSQASRSTKDIGGTISLTYPYTVVMDEQFASETDVENAIGLPTLGSYKDGGRASSYSKARDENNPYIWHVDVTYTNQSAGGYSPISFDGSDNRLVSLSFGSRAYSKTIDFAYFPVSTITKTQSPAKPNWSNVARSENNEPVVNTAFDPVVGVSELIYSKIIRISQIEDITFDPNNVHELIGTINSADVLIGGADVPASEGSIISFAPELKNVGSDDVGYPDGRYWISTYEIEVMPGGWYQKVVNDGYRRLVDGNPLSKVDIFNKDINDSSENPDDTIQEAALLKTNGDIELVSDNILFLIIWSRWGTSWDNINFVRDWNG